MVQQKMAIVYLLFPFLFNFCVSLNREIVVILAFFQLSKMRWYEMQIAFFFTSIKNSSSSKSYIILDWRDSVEVKVFALHVANSGSNPSHHL